MTAHGGVVESGPSPKMLLTAADAAWDLLRRDNSLDPYDLLAAVVWPETEEMRTIYTA